MNRYSYCFTTEIPDWLKPHKKILSDCFDQIDQPNTDKSYLKLIGDKLIWWDSELGDFEIDSFKPEKKPKILKGKSELLAKALEIKKSGDLVIDATVGLGKDSRFLIELGAKVVGCEKDPLVFLLLQSALQQADKKIQNSFELHFEDCQKFLAHFNPDGPFNIYLDPMFEGELGSAKPKKSMQVFRKLNLKGDLQILIDAALASRAKRVVVKQPLKSREHQYKVIHCYQGKSVRYDLLSR